MNYCELDDLECLDLCTAIIGKTIGSYHGIVLDNGFEELPDCLKYTAIIRAYLENDGHKIPAIRKKVRELKKYGKPDLPEWIKSQKEITIYRAGEEPIEKAKYRISWTTDLEEAKRILNRQWNTAKYLYKGVIRTDKIITYTNEADEHEVMQYRNVRNIELLEQL